MMLAIILFPVFSFAQGSGKLGTPSSLDMSGTCGSSVKDIGNVLCRIGFILNRIVPAIMILGVVYLVWGVVFYVIAGDEEAKTKGRDRIIAGIIGLVIIVGMWGLVSIVVKSFGLNNADLTVINPVNIVGNNAQGTGSASCFTTYKGKGANATVTDLMTYATCVIGQAVVPLLFTIAIAFFIWGVVQIFINGDDEEKRSKGKQFMIWGIVALTVMISVWGLVQLLGSSFNIKTDFYPKVQN